MICIPKLALEIRDISLLVLLLLPRLDDSRIVSYSVFVKQIDILRSFLRRPQTDRFPDDIPKKLRWNRNRDSCEKSATGAEKTGIRRIPAGIGNLEYYLRINM